MVMLSWWIYPPPEGANMSDSATMKTYIETLPTSAFLVILVAHAGGALVGGLVAALIARRSALVLDAVVGRLFFYRRDCERSVDSASNLVRGHRPGVVRSRRDSRRQIGAAP